MKKLLIFFILFGVTLLYTGTGCKKAVEDWECSDPKTPIERTFKLYAKIKYKDNVAYQGNVSFDIYKTYCTGKSSGDYKANGNADVSGFWRSGKSYTYKFDDALDHVNATFSILNPITKVSEFTEERFYYSDVENKPGGVEKTYQITLSWNSDDN